MRMYSVLPPPSDEILAERVAKSAPPIQALGAEHNANRYETGNLSGVPFAAKF
jgi:hypothetical protein